MAGLVALWTLQEGLVWARESNTAIHAHVIVNFDYTSQLLDSRVDLQEYEINS